MKTNPKRPQLIMVYSTHFLLPLLLFLIIFFLLFFLQSHHHPPSSENLTYIFGDLKIRPEYDSYESYKQHQLNKTLDPKLRKIWKTRDWDCKVQEVEALRHVGVFDSMGIALVPCPPLPFENETFDFEFSNVFDHALYPHKFVSELEWTLKPNGVCVLHVALSRQTDKYSANDRFSVEPLVEMFKGSEVVHV
ncbi:S-adenosyl-L-methionine-dependent methyltransferases superfamily protein [Fagus crenata]